MASFATGGAAAALLIGFGVQSVWLVSLLALTCSVAANGAFELLRKRRGERSDSVDLWRLEGSNVGEWELDCDSNVVYCSKVLRKMLQLPVGEYSVPGFKILSYVDEEDRRRFSDAIRWVKQHIATKSVDCRVQLAEGKFVWMEVVMRPLVKDGKVQRISGIVSDISDRKSVEAELVSRRAALEAIVENTDDIVISIDRDYSITALNTSFRVLMKASYGARIKIGDYLFAYTPPEVEALWLPRYNAALDGKTVRTEEIFYVGGNPFYFDVSLKPIRVGGKVTGVAVYSRHITEHKKREVEWLAAKEKAEESDRLKSAFLANMSHEIRTPLNAIMGFAQLLREDSVTEEERKRFLEIVLSNGSHLLRILGDIMDLAQIESNQLRVESERFELKLLIGEMAALFGKQTKSTSGGEVRFEVQDCTSRNDSMVTDATRLKQILINLVSNALKYTETGYVRLSYRRVDPEFVEFSIADSGSGIPDESKRAIFERFNRGSEHLNARKEGVGLGLSICRGIVRILGGEIWVEDNEPHGTIFKFTIRDQDEVAQPNPLDRPPQIAEKRVDGESGIDLKGTVLVAEDDDTNFVMMKEFLKQYELDCVRATNGKEAVRIVKRDPDSIALVIMDLSMPIMNGFDATRAIKRLNPDIPVVAHTAHAMKRDLDFARDAGCSDCLVKPVTLESVNDLLRRFSR